MDAAAPDGAQSKNPFGFFSRLIPSEFVAPLHIKKSVILNKQVICPAVQRRT
jgi:hypothetical protein